MKDKIQNDLKAAMKSGDKLRMMALRGVLSEISRLEKDVRREPNDAEILQIIKRERAQREESLEFARKAARQDLIDQNETEAKILDSYLPATASADDVRAEIAAAIAARGSMARLQASWPRKRSRRSRTPIKCGTQRWVPHLLRQG